MTDGSGAGVTLPRAPVLGYLTNISTPTRVRIVAARVVLVLAVLNLALAALTLVMTGWDCWQIAHDRAALRGVWGGPALPPTLDDYRYALWHGPGIVAFVCFVFFMAPGIVLLFLSGPIRRGHKIPSILAVLYFVPLMLLSVLAAALFASEILVEVLGIAGRPHPAMCFWLVVLPVAVLVVLLLNDLCRFLIWIARNPMIDKPRVAFLGGR
jgi:hypothetical protein